MKYEWEYYTVGRVGLGFDWLKNQIFLRKKYNTKILGKTQDAKPSP